MAGLDRRLDGIDADLAIEADVTEEPVVTEAVEQAVRVLGGLDGVAHCAGIAAKGRRPLHTVSLEDWDRMIRVNLTGSFVVARAALPHLTRRGGAVVLVASVNARWPQPGGAAYAAAKAGVVALARAIALDYGSAGVRANAVSPGWIDTPMASAVLGLPPVRRQIEASIPLGRVSAPADVAELVGFLLSGASRQVTGAEIILDGGQSLVPFTEGGELATRSDTGQLRARTTRP